MSNARLNDQSSPSMNAVHRQHGCIREARHAPVAAPTGDVEQLQASGT